MTFDNDLLTIREIITSCDNLSEDIDIHIHPDKKFGINENPNNTKPKNVAARRSFYDSLAKSIQISGVVSAMRDLAFDDEKAYRSGGIRLHYDNKVDKILGLKEGILLEAGFDMVKPNKAMTISSWAYDRALQSEIEIIDNRAVGIPCYHPGYTFVEKLQTIATKFRQEKEGKVAKPNFMRQYYDVYCLLGDEVVQNFIGSENYLEHKENRFPQADFAIPIAENEAFLLNDPAKRADYKKRYSDTSDLYYKGQPLFDELLDRISNYISKL